ncbi:MAG: hypothetical protein ACK4YP_14635, partial [Myxococcota bacterium]
GFGGVGGRHKLHLSRGFSVVAPPTSIIDGIAKRLLPNEDIVAEVRPFAQRLVTTRFGPERLGQDAFRVLQHAQAAFRDVPTQANQLLLDLERGRISITAKDPEAEELRMEIRHAAIRLSLALCALALAVSGSVLIAPWAPDPLGVPLLAIGGFGVCGVSALMFMGLAIHWLFATRFHPRDWRRRLLAVVRFFVGERTS